MTYNYKTIRVYNSTDIKDVHFEISFDISHFVNEYIVYDQIYNKILIKSYLYIWTIFLTSEVWSTILHYNKIGLLWWHLTSKRMSWKVKKGHFNDYLLAWTIREEIDIAKGT